MRSKRVKAISYSCVSSEPLYDVKKGDEQIGDLLNWYSNNQANKEAREYFLQYLEQNNYSQEQIKIIKHSDWPTTVGWCARINTIVKDGSKKCDEYIKKVIAECIKNPPKQIIEQEEKLKPTIQDHLKEQLNDVYSEIEYQLDCFLENKCFNKNNFDVYEFLTEKNVHWILAEKISNHYISTTLQELNSAFNQEDEQLVEAYSHLMGIELKRFIYFVERIVYQSKQYKEEKQKTQVALRKPRRKKVKTPEQLTSKVKYKPEDEQFNLKSIPPKEIIGAIQLVVFNTKTRMLGTYICSNNHGLTVKGTTILNFDEVASIAKKLRKPKEVLPKVVNQGKTALRNTLEKIRAKEKALNGRINSDTLLLKVLQ